MNQQIKTRSQRLIDSGKANYKYAKSKAQRLAVLSAAHPKSGLVWCVTCGIGYMFNDSRIQGGHYIPAGHLATCLDPENLNAQCRDCNFGGGMPEEYAKYLGKAKVRRLQSKKLLASPMSKYMLADYIADVIEPELKKQEKRCQAILDGEA